MIIHRIVFGLIISSMLITIAYADVWIPEESRSEFLDANQYFTIVGAVKNNESVSVISTIQVSLDDEEPVKFTISSIGPNSEMPFKFKFMNERDIKRVTVKLEFTVVNESVKTVSVIYDDTLVIHDDGHLTGRIYNYGSDTIRNIEVLALIHGDDSVLDMGRSDKISIIESNEIINFTMYPENGIKNISYYSCFAIGDVSIINVTTKRKGLDYKFRYDSGIWFAYGKFNKDGNNLTLYAYNSWPAVMSANIELPINSIYEEFDITINDAEIKHLQSLDERRNWHLIFSIQPHQSGQLIISGFKDSDGTYAKNMSLTEIFEKIDISKSTKISKFKSECMENTERIFRSNGSSVCVFPSTIPILLSRGWSILG